MPEDDLWSEAAAIVRAEHDALVYEEARGLVVAEMSSVTLADRLCAVEPGTSLRVRTLDGTQLRGEAEAAAADHLLLACEQGLQLVPTHAIATISTVPRVAHAESGSSPSAQPAQQALSSLSARATSWRRVLRDFFGYRLSIRVTSAMDGPETIDGTLTWVGSDHLGVIAEGLEVTVPWGAVTGMRLPRSPFDQDSVTA